jgi:hypothetical protein
MSVDPARRVGCLTTPFACTIAVSVRSPTLNVVPTVH